MQSSQSVAKTNRWNGVERQTVLLPVVFLRVLRRVVFVNGGCAPLDVPLDISYALQLLVRVVDVVLLREKVSLDLRILQQLEVSLCNHSVSLL